MKFSHFTQDSKRRKNSEMKKKTLQAASESERVSERESTLKYIKKHFTISINKRATYFDVERAINFWVSAHNTTRAPSTTTVEHKNI